jgi:Tol biopolymer transport system component
LYSVVRSRHTALLTPLLAVIFGALVISFLIFSTPRTAARGSAPAAANVFNGRIAFTSTRNSDAFNIYAMNPDGSFPVRLTDDESGSNPFSTYDFDPAWSPDGSKIAFVSNRENSSFEIFTMNADGSNVHQLTNDQVSDGQPMWSPDGTKIAFTRGGGCAILLNPALKSRMVPADDNPCVPYIYVMNADGSNKTKISQGENEAWPVWSPDGTKLAFATVDFISADGNDIYVMNADGSNRTRLTNDTFIDLPSSWSPDGTRIAFASNRDTPQTGGYRFQLYTMSPNGSNVVRLTASSFDDIYPVFSPDGTKIAFQRAFETQNSATLTSEVYVMNADGSDQKNLTNNTADDFGPPAWQPLSSPLQVPPPAILQFNPNDYMVPEGAGSVQITVERSGSLTEATTVRYATSDGNADGRNDFIDAFGQLSFASGETSKTITVLITDDGYVEGQESFQLDLFDVTGNAIVGNASVADVKIIDNDTAPAGNPIANSEFFVRQHYHDFFNREPDAAGLAFWVNNIEACGTDAGCREVKRVDTSAAFFFSIEFQDTGFYIYRLHSGALMFPPNYLDFTRDSQAISRGIVVGAPGWEALLEANTQRFTEEFVSRTRFKLLYPEVLSAQEYVDGLYFRLLLTPPPAERAQAIAAFGSGDTAGRARALRIVTNNADYIRYVFNTSFVAMQYYGYLRRDIDPNGYQFWFNKLQQFNGDFRRAEMVKAFITSSEYRLRFGPQ